MLVIGARGFAKEILDVLRSLGELENVAFYDDVNDYLQPFLYEKYPILKSKNEVKEFFSISNKNFTLGLGNPFLRYEMYKKFSDLGGELVSTRSPLAVIGNFNVQIGKGSNVMQNSTISCSVTIGKACLIYYGAIVAHDCQLGDFVEISPNATILGKVKIGSFTQIGANATILPGIEIGRNVIIGAGAVVTKNISDNSLALGVPARIIKTFNK